MATPATAGPRRCTLPIHAASSPSQCQRLALLWPSCHLGQLGLRVVGRDGGGSAGHVAALLALTVAFCALAHRRLRHG